MCGGEVFFNVNGGVDERGGQVRRDVNDNDKG